jgi:hypothetical protein
MSGLDSGLDFLTAPSLAVGNAAACTIPSTPAASFECFGCILGQQAPFSTTCFGFTWRYGATLKSANSGRSFLRLWCCLSRHRPVRIWSLYFFVHGTPAATMLYHCRIHMANAMRKSYSLLAAAAVSLRPRATRHMRLHPLSLGVPSKPVGAPLTRVARFPLPKADKCSCAPTSFGSPSEPYRPLATFQRRMAKGISTTRTRITSSPVFQ